MRETKKNIFGDVITIRNNDFIFLKLDSSFKRSLDYEFNKRFNYLTERLNERLTKSDKKNIKKNINDQFNFHLSKITKNKNLDYLNEDKIKIEVNKKDEGYYIKTYVNMNNIYKNNLSELETLVRKQLIKDYSTAAKYCILGYLSDKRKFKLDEEK